MKLINCSLLLLALFASYGCAPTAHNVEMVQGPPVQDITTPFDAGLRCLKGRINPAQTFSVGTILDSTGKEQITDSGTGKFVTQGAGDIVQSALMLAGVTVVNRRDPRVLTTEIQWGIGTNKQLIPSKFFITGSINTLDFIPGGGFESSVAGGGPRARQARVLIGMDLFLTETNTGRIVASIPLQKQIVENEFGIGLTRFFGTTLVDIDVGAIEREALQYTLRNMMHLATFELLTQVMSPKNYMDCREMINNDFASIKNSKTSDAIKNYSNSDKKENKSEINRENQMNTIIKYKSDNNDDSTSKNSESEKNSPDSFWKNEDERTTLPPAVLYR